MSSQQWVRARAADVRVTWSRQERKIRAKASERRCQQLLSHLGIDNERRGTPWVTKNCSA